jgi:hypothetical protein
MSASPRQIQQRRNASAARQKALRALAHRHPEEFRELYLIEAGKRGINVKPTTGIEHKETKIKAVIAEIEDLGLVDGVRRTPAKVTGADDLPEFVHAATQKATRTELLSYQLTSHAPPVTWDVPEPEMPPAVPEIPEAPW